MQEHQVRFPPESPYRMFHCGVQPYGAKRVLDPADARKVAHLRGERELRQQVTGGACQDLVGAEAEVVGAGVERGDAEVQRPSQEAAFVTRPV